MGSIPIEMIIFFLAQSVIIISAIVAAWVTQKVQIARLETHVADLRTDHAKLSVKMDGMSRHVAELTGRISSCPNLKGWKE